MGLTLYVGADESNHGSKRGKEIVVATFSLYQEDGKVVHLPCGRDFENAETYLNDLKRGWVFTLNGKFSRECLTFEVPGLIDFWMKKNYAKNEISRIDSAFDGVLSMNEQEQFVEEMNDRYGFHGKLSIRHHAKTQWNGKKPEKFYDSKLVWAADTIASNLLGEFRKKKDLTTYEKYVPLEERF